MKFTRYRNYHRVVYLSGPSCPHLCTWIVDLTYETCGEDYKDNFTYFEMSGGFLALHVKVQSSL